MNASVVQCVSVRFDFVEREIKNILTLCLITDVLILEYVPYRELVLSNRLK